VTTNRTRQVRSVAVLADSDSRWKWGVQLARRLNPSAAVSGYQFAGSQVPSRRQLTEAGIAPDAVSVVSAGDLLAAVASTRPDVLILAMPGGGCQAILHLLAAADLPQRPLVLTGYVGVVYEKVVEGLLSRAGSDVIAANSPADLERFRAVLAGVGVPTSSLALTRLPFLGEAGLRASGRFTVTFAGQPSVPNSRWHRRYLVERLVEHAVRHPGRDVLIKLRSLPGERATHTELYPYDELFRSLGADRPPNLKLVGGPMGRVLDRTDLLVTVSSTAAVEAVHRGISTAVLTDFGIRESLGNAYFVGSGCLASFDDLDAGGVPVADEGWARRAGLGHAADPLPERVAEMLAAGPLPPLKPFYTASNGTAFLPGLLASYGVGVDGKPLPFLVDGAPGGLRKAVRRSARTMYRHGAQVVAPALRRLASL
jgi:hypothetical protein